MSSDRIISIRKQFEYYKMLGEKTLLQLKDEKLFWQFNEDSNSIATIIKHLHGNMMSRWTDFMSTDGEKEWRNRDGEFESEVVSRQQLMEKWNEGWDCLFRAIDVLSEDDLGKTIYIRNQGYSVEDALNRQLAHYPYHIGQMVFIGKILTENGWTSLSIPKGKSQHFNADKFSLPKDKAHFTDEFLGKGTST